MTITNLGPRSAIGILALLALVGTAVYAPAEAQLSGMRAGATVFGDGGAEPAARLELAVERTATSATAALAAAEIDAQRVVRALAASGLPVSAVRPLPAVVTAEFEERGVIAVNTIRDDRRLRGYRAVIGLVVDLPEARTAGLLLDLAHGAGATRAVAITGNGR
jgi:uncharacterized protein YggE